MGIIRVSETPLEGLRLIEPECFVDHRGDFEEVYQYHRYSEAGIASRFIQDNQVYSRQGVLRGLHYQKRFPQDKLIWAVSGQVYDVAVDLRPSSSTYGRWFGCMLSGENRRQLFIPGGFAHGYLVLSAKACILYKCSEDYHPEDEAGICWNDPELGIDWPIQKGQEIILSEKDRSWPGFKTHAGKQRNGEKS